MSHLQRDSKSSAALPTPAYWFPRETTFALHIGVLAAWRQERRKSRLRARRGHLVDTANEKGRHE